MYTRILVPIDGSTAANLALQEAIRLARRRKTAIRLLYVVERLSLNQGLHPVLVIADILMKMEAAGKQVLLSAKAAVQAANVPVQAVMRKPATGSTADAIVREAQRWDAQLIVMGAHGLRGAGSMLMGSTAQGVLRAARCPLLAVERSARSDSKRMGTESAPYRRILVPVDGSLPARAGLREAIRLASGCRDAVLRLLHVVEPHSVLHGMNLPIADTWLRGRVKQGEKILREAQACARRNGVRSQTVLHKRADQAATDVITDQAKSWKADIVIMGTHGRSGISRAVLGSNAEAIVRASNAPVMTVRA